MDTYGDYGVHAKLNRNSIRINLPADSVGSNQGLILGQGGRSVHILYIATGSRCVKYIIYINLPSGYLT